MENLKNIVLRKAKIIDSKSKYNNQTKDIFIQNGIISKISNNIKLNEPFFEIKIKNLHISPGWLDLHARFGEPGLEERESIQNGLKTAAKGGFTSILLMPDTIPPIQNKADIKFVLKEAEQSLVDLLPTGCITKNCLKEEITEMFDMHIHGARAFTNGKSSLKNAMIMNVALEYVKNFAGLIMTTCLDADIANNGQINESEISTKIGLKPLPEIAENIIVHRDLEILKYTNSKLHISTISTQKSIQYIKQAKKQNLNISTDVAAHQIILNDEALQNFNTNLKVLPPIRDEKTRKYIIDNIINGTIDAISSDHTPVDLENKQCEFENAEFGIIGLKTVFPIINTILKNKMKLENIIDLISRNPRRILNIKNPLIEESQKANMTFFDPSKKWTYTKNDISSRSKNTPFINYEFIGKVIGVINNGKLILNT